jgi:hypothetical protein
MVLFATFQLLTEEDSAAFVQKSTEDEKEKIIILAE